MSMPVSKNKVSSFTGPDLGISQPSVCSLTSFLKHSLNIRYSISVNITPTNTKTSFVYPRNQLQCRVHTSPSISM